MVAPTCSPAQIVLLAGFQPAILALSEMLAGPPLSGQQDAGAASNMQRHYGVNGSQKNQRQAKAECAPAASCRTSGAGVPGASVAGFVADAEENRRERDRDRRIRRRNAAKVAFRELWIAEAARARRALRETRDSEK